MLLLLTFYYEKQTSYLDLAFELIMNWSTLFCGIIPRMNSVFKVFRFQRKTLLLFFGFFFFIIIISFFLTRFLRNAWTDFHEIFRDGVYWSSLAEISFSSDDVTSGRRYWRFSDFEGVILWRIDLRNDWRYLLQIFTDDRQRTELYSMWSASR